MVEYEPLRVTLRPIRPVGSRSWVASARLTVTVFVCDPLQEHRLPLVASGGAEP